MMPRPMMEYRYLGSTGLKVSALCLGTMTFGGNTRADTTGRPGQVDMDGSHRILDRFVLSGGNFIDTADVYPADGSGNLGASEKIIGEWLKDRHREDLIIATKVRFNTRDDDLVKSNGGGLTRNHILWSIDQSLERLNTNYVDLYQIHAWDHATPVEETFRTLNDLVRVGKIRYVGVSNVTGWQLQKICDTVQRLQMEPVVTLQAQYSLLSRGIELELTDVCKNEGIGILPWSPLKGGLLTGKFGRDVAAPPAGSRLAWVAENPGKRTQACPLPQDFATEKNYLLLDALKEISEQKTAASARTKINIDDPDFDDEDEDDEKIDGYRYRSNEVTMAQVAIRWAMQKPGVSSVIFGAKTMKQLKDNLAASKFSLSDEEMSRLDECSAMDIPY